LESKKSKAYKTAEVLKEYEHYVDEARPTEFNWYATFLVAALALCFYPLIMIL
jgi:hypothetical protein